MLNSKIKKITLNIFFFLSFLILIQNHSFAQNIFDELKKATEQIQKDLENQSKDSKEIKLPSAQDNKKQNIQQNIDQKPTAKTTNNQNQNSQVQKSDSKNLEDVLSKFPDLFGAKIFSKLNTVKVENKQFDRKFIINADMILDLGMYTSFTPKDKNSDFKEYFVVSLPSTSYSTTSKVYGPNENIIVAVYARNKNTFSDFDKCMKAMRPYGEFLVKKFSTNSELQQSYSRQEEYIKLKIENQIIKLGTTCSHKHGYDDLSNALIHQMSALAPKLKDPNGWLFLEISSITSPGSDQNQEYRKVLSQKIQSKEKGSFDKKEKSGTFKGM
jgi:hypothetical protein